MDPQRLLDFLSNIQRLLSEGVYVATYKFALLQSLADLSVELDSAEDGSLELPVSLVAEKFIRYYWRQVAPYGDGILRQNTGRQAAIINQVAGARAKFDGALGAAAADRAAWDALQKAVATTVGQMPLWKLQVIAGRPHEFLYRKSEYRNGVIRLLPGVPASFRALHGLVTSLVQGAWVRQIRRIPANRELLGESGDLADFLFGSGRASLEKYRAILTAHQSRRCFYCQKDIKRDGELDHFIAWSRYPVDLGHNFVFSCSPCNRGKSDFLAHSSHLSRWWRQNFERASELADCFDQENLIHDAARSQHIAIWAYEQGESAGANAWLHGKEVEPLNREWRNALRLEAPLDLVAERPTNYE